MDWLWSEGRKHQVSTNIWSAKKLKSSDCKRVQEAYNSSIACEKDKWPRKAAARRWSKGSHINESTKQLDDDVDLLWILRIRLHASTALKMAIKTFFWENSKTGCKSPILSSKHIQPHQEKHNEAEEKYVIQLHHLHCLSFAFSSTKVIVQQCNLISISLTTMQPRARKTI